MWSGRKKTRGLSQAGNLCVLGYPGDCTARGINMEGDGCGFVVLPVPQWMVRKPSSGRRHVSCYASEGISRRRRPHASVLVRQLSASAKTLFPPRKKIETVAVADERQLLLKAFRQMALLGKVFSVLILLAASLVIMSVAKTQLAFAVTASVASMGVFALHMVYNHLEFMICSVASNALTPSLFQVRRPRKIILVRHGESEGNVDRTLYRIRPDNKLELTEKGRRQAFEAGRKLKAEIGDEQITFYVSPYTRARQTLDEMLEGGGFKNVTINENPHLREQEFGNFQDPDKFEHYSKEREACGWFYHRVPGGESGADLYTRATMFLDTMFRDEDKLARAGQPAENIVIVSHGLTMRMICMRYFNWSVERLENIRAPGNAEAWKMQRVDDLTGYELVTDVTAKTQAQKPFRSSSAVSAGSGDSKSGGHSPKPAPNSKGPKIGPWTVFSEKWQVGGLFTSKGWLKGNA